jgi:aminopeptidase N
VVNDGDLTYAKMRLLGSDLAALPELLPLVADPLARALLWSAAWDCTRDAELPAARFVEMVTTALPSEPEVGLFGQILARAVGVAVPEYLEPAARPSALAGLVRACGAVLADPSADAGRRLAAVRGYARCAGPVEAAVLHDWLAGHDAPEGVEMDADLRWIVLRRLVVLGVAEAADIEAEAERDRSAQGAEQAAACRAALPELVAKALAWRSIVDGAALSNRLVLATAEGFWQPEQSDLARPYVERYFLDLPRMTERLASQVLSQVAQAAFPRYAVDQATIVLAERLLSRAGLHPALRRAVLDRSDDLRRALAARHKL